MKIQTFTNAKGLIYGEDPKRVSCDKAGVLKIGSAEITVLSDRDAIVPILCNGCTGVYKATFTSEDGTVYALENVTIKSGRIAPPPKNAVDLMELRCITEALQERCDRIDACVEELSHRYDCNSLNFLIKGD